MVVFLSANFYIDHLPAFASLASFDKYLDCFFFYRPDGSFPSHILYQEYLSFENLEY